MNSLLKRSAQAKARLTSVRNRGGVKAVLREQGGAIDLASIMVGVLVIGIIGGVIAATVFAVIPWSQNQAAQGALDSVKTAESTTYAMTAADGGTSVYQDKATLTAADTAEAIGIQKAAGVDIATDTNGTSYVAVSVSATGNIYSITSADPNTKVEFDDAAAFETANAGYTLDVADGAATLTPVTP